MADNLPSEKELYPVCYVIADDDEEELMLMRLALARHQKPLPIREFSDGQQVIDYLTRNHTLRSDEDTHWLLVLDMHMPRLNGLETLKIIRQNPDFDSIPILLFADSQDKQLIRAALDSGANGCVSKPRSMNEYAQLFDQFFSTYLKGTGK